MTLFHAVFRLLNLPLLARRYDARGVDVWCAGVVLFTMVAGHMPFEGDDVDATLELIRTAEPSYPAHLSPEVIVSRFVCICALLNSGCFKRLFLWCASNTLVGHQVLS